MCQWCLQFSVYNRAPCHNTVVAMMAFSSHMRILEEDFWCINLGSCTTISLFKPGSAQSGSMSWDDCGAFVINSRRHTSSWTRHPIMSSCYYSQSDVSHIPGQSPWSSPHSPACLSKNGAGTASGSAVLCNVSAHPWWWWNSSVTWTSCNPRWSGDQCGGSNEPSGHSHSGPEENTKCYH